MENNNGWSGWNFDSQVAKNTATSQARDELYNSDTFKNASIAFQKMTMALLDSHDNQQYIVAAAQNAKVIERGDFELLEKLAGARTWLKSSRVKELSFDEIKEEADNYRFVMRVLTSEPILNRDDASLVVNTVLSSSTSVEANEKVREIFSETLEAQKKNDSLNAMVSEAVPTSSIENVGHSK